MRTVVNTKFGLASDFGSLGAPKTKNRSYHSAVITIITGIATSNSILILIFQSINISITSITTGLTSMSTL